MKLIGLYHNGGPDFGGIYENGSTTPFECSPISEAVKVINVSNVGDRCIITTRDRISDTTYTYTVCLETRRLLHVS